MSSHGSIRTSILGTIQSNTQITSDELRRHTDHFIEMKAIMPNVQNHCRPHIVKCDQRLWR